MKKGLFITACIVLLTSCGQNSSEYKKLKIENDSLKLESVKSTSELEDMLGILNEVETNFKAIRDAEDYLSIVQQAGGEFTPSRKEELRNNMQLVSETLQKNKEQLAKLQDQLNKGNIKSAQLKKTIARLSAEIDQKTTMILTLQDDLAKKNVRIQELDEIVSTLNEDVEGLALTTTVQAELISTQETELNTAFYCFGTSRELKDQKILSGGNLFTKSKVLQPGFNKDYFVKIDIRDIKEIPLFTNKAKLKSSHPESSYNLTEDEDENLTLNITEPKVFWSLSKYLVIEVK